MRDKGPILVPLDGSELAEGALPYAVALAKALGAGVLLVCTWEGGDGDLPVTFPAIATEIQQKATAYYGDYLDGISKRIGAGVSVQTKVASGDAAHEILKAADDAKARLLVMATHGRSGIGRWVYGSTAARLVHDSHIPIMAVGPHALERSAAGIEIKHLMVPIDGSPLSESAVAVAKEIAAALGARVTLARAVNWAMQTYPFGLPDAYLPEIDAELEKGAKEYLRKQEAALAPVPCDAFVVRGSAADGLIDLEQTQSIDLVVMTTRARTGIARAALGSTADRMLQGEAPVLLVPPEAVGAS